MVAFRFLKRSITAHGPDRSRNCVEQPAAGVDEFGSPACRAFSRSSGEIKRLCHVEQAHDLQNVLGLARQGLAACWSAMRVGFIVSVQQRVAHRAANVD